MADHEGWYLKANVDISGLLQANKQANTLLATLKKVDAGVGTVHGNDALAKQIKSADIATASYIERLKSAGKNYEADREKAKMYSDQVNRLTQRQKGLVSELGRIAEKSGRNSDAYNIQKARINETATAINHFKSNLKETQSEMNQLRPTAFNHLVSGAKRITSATDTMKSKIHSAWTNIKGGATAAAAGIGAVGAAAVSGAKQAGAIQQTYREINNLAVLGGEKQKEVTRAVTKMQSSGRDMSIKYGKSQHEIAEGYEDLIKRGYTTKQALGAMRTELQASVASGDKFSDVTTVSSQVLDAFGLRAKSTNRMIKNTKKAVNELAYSADATSTSFGSLGIGMSYVGTAAKANKISLAETASAMGVLSNNGLEADKAGTGLRSTINGITNQINKIGKKNSIFSQLGIKKSEMLDAHGNMKSLATDMGVLYKHIKEHSSGGSETNGFFKSIFGTSGMNAAIIMAKNSGEISNLTKRTEKAGKTGSYVAQLAAKNMGTAQGSAASAQQAMGAFKMTLGNALLPAINKASNELAKFLLSKDGKKFQKDVGGAVAKVADGLVNLIKWTATHKKEVKWIGTGILAGYSIAKAAKFVSFLGDVRSGLLKLADAEKVLGKSPTDSVTGKVFSFGSKTIKGLRGKGAGAGKLNGLLQSARSAGGFRKLTTAGKIGTVAAGAGVAIDAGSSFYSAFKHRNNATKRSKDIGKGLGAALGGGIGLWFGGPLGAALGAKIGGIVGKWGGSAVNKFTKGWQRKKPPKKFWSLANLGWSAHSMWNGFTKSVGNTLTWFKKHWKVITQFLLHPIATGYSLLYKKNKKFHDWVDGLTKYFRDAIKPIADWINKYIGKPIGAVAGFVGKVAGGIGKFGGDVKNFINKHGAGTASQRKKVNRITGHAQGGFMRTNHGALVGEAGPELAYKVNGSSARLLGANGPQITKIHAGERILNARDTRKVIGGGLGKGVVLKGYATGNTKLGKTTKKVGTDYKKISSSATKSLNDLTKHSKSSWAKITSQTKRETSRTRKSTVNDYSNMKSKVNRQMQLMHNGVVKTAKGTAKGFGGAMGKMKGYAKNSMSDTIGQLNKGIGSIDKVLSQFGGNGSVIKPVKFATGTGALPHNTLAMVNDAPTGPRQEAIIKHTGEIWLPQKHNQILPLEKGDAVLNGYQTKELGLAHFAKGSGVSHNQLRKIASRNLANPANSFANGFTDSIKSSGPRIQRGSTNLAKNASTHFGVPWNTAMWTVINDAIGGSASGKGGSRESFLKYAESTFTGVPYQMGAMTKKLSDCSGMVAQALQHFGVNIGRTTVAMQSSSGVQYLGKSLSKTLPGDLVIFGHGTGAAGHVGIIKNPKTGTMFNETPPKARVTRIADDKGMGYGYYRVRGLHNAKQTKKAVKANKQLMALAKRELGASAISWIKKNLSEDDLGSLGSFKVGGDLRDRARALAAGLRKLDPRATKNGIAAVLGNWNFESGGLNPGAVNAGGGASGLGQWLGGRKANLLAYARKHGTSWKNAGTQLSFAVKGEGSDSAILRSVLEGHGSVASLANKFSQLWERGGYNAQHVQGAMAIRKALGFAKGGTKHSSTPFIAGEQGPELITAANPVHIDSHETTKRKFRGLSNVIEELNGKRSTTQRKAGNGKPVSINININGPISSRRDAIEYSNLIKEKVSEVIYNLFGNEEGEDPSIY